VRRRWYLYLPIFAIWGLAYARLFIDATPRLPVLFNWTPSLPYRIAWLVCTAPHPPAGVATSSSSLSMVRRRRVTRGGCAASPSSRSCGACRASAVTVAGRHVAINGEEVGVAKLQAYDHSPLDPITPTVIPPGHYYVQGTSPDSFDSRYQASGLVRAEQVVGVVVPLY
jgi:conjugal transfer pilin signal peptidase TrbI